MADKINYTVYRVAWRQVKSFSSLTPFQPSKTRAGRGESKKKPVYSRALSNRPKVGRFSSSVHCGCGILSKEKTSRLAPSGKSLSRESATGTTISESQVLMYNSCDERGCIFPRNNGLILERSNILITLILIF